jgi:hypothetical protein
MRTTRVPAQIVIDFNAGDGIPSWHFNDDAEMLNPALWTAAELYQNKGKSEGDAATATLDGDYLFGDTGMFKRLKVGLRYDDRSAAQSSPQPVAPDFLGGPFDALPEGYQYINEGFMDGNADVPGAGWSRTAGTSGSSRRSARPLRSAREPTPFKVSTSRRKLCPPTRWRIWISAISSCQRGRAVREGGY